MGWIVNAYYFSRLVFFGALCANAPFDGRITYFVESMTDLITYSYDEEEVEWRGMWDTDECCIIMIQYIPFLFFLVRFAVPFLVLFLLPGMVMMESCSR
jgi:hypothetical protein